jgi:drug/metabolite transporter (DMT)-like permease
VVVRGESTARRIAGRERVGIGLAALCAASGAFVPAVARLTSERLDPLATAAATSIFAALAATVVLGARGELRGILRPGAMPRLLLLGTLGTAVPYLLLFAGAGRVSAIETALCLQSEPIFAFLGTWLVLGHQPTLRRIASLLVLTAGVGLALGTAGHGVSSGAWLVLLAPLAWQTSHLFVLRHLRGVTPSALTGARYIYGSAVLGVVALLEGGPQGDELATMVALLPALALQGMVLSFLGTLAWYGAIARLDLTRTTAIVVPSIPLLSLAASFVILGETPTARQLAGLLLTAGGVLAFATAPDVAPEEEPLPPGAA